jgi:hypothetical protein
MISFYRILNLDSIYFIKNDLENYLESKQLKTTQNNSKQHKTKQKQNI